MKTKKYILEVRKHRKKDLIPNKTTHVIGIFSSVDKAVKWIQSDGQTFFGKKFPRKAFWAIVEGYVDSGELCLQAFYDKQGNWIGN